MSSGEKIISEIKKECDEKIAVINAETEKSCNEILDNAKKEAKEITENARFLVEEQSAKLLKAHQSKSELEKRNMLFTPRYYTNFIGASFFTIATIEKEFDVKPVSIEDLVFFYSFDNMEINSTGTIYVGFHAINREGVVAQMDFRLLGADSAQKFITSAIEYGYKLYSKGKDLLVTPNSKYLLPELTTNSVKVYRKKTDNGYVHIEIGANDSHFQEYYISISRARK